MIHAKENRYLNRECTWINFNERVVNEAAISSIPLLERVNFLSISASNNDEFFMIRVAGIKHLLAEQITRKDIAGLTPKEQFEAIQLMEHSQCRRQYKIYRDIKKRLSAEGIHIISFDEANEEEKLYLEIRKGRNLPCSYTLGCRYGSLCSFFGELIFKLSRIFAT